MAGTFKVAFAIEGDATKALKAIEGLAGAVDRLASILEKLGGVAASAGAKQEAAADKANRGFRRAEEGANRYANALMRVQSAGGGMSKMPPPPPPIPPSRQLPPGGGDFIEGQFRDVTAISKFQDFIGKINTGLGTMSQRLMSVSSGALMLGRNLLSGIGTALPKLITGFGGFVDKVRQSLMAVNDLFRFTSQAITNVGRSLFFFVSIPLAAFFVSLTRSAIDFEDAMVRVAKTTGLTGSQLEVLSEHLRMLARNTGTSIVELAKIAEVIGQMGVTSVNAITNLTHIFEMMTVASGMAAEDVATDLGQIANAFGWNLNASSENVFKLANVINMLENTTASSTTEIIKSMAKWAQAARVIGIVSDGNAKGAASVAALSASLVSMGVTAEEAGTALKNMSLYVLKNADDVTKFMGANQKYATSQDVVNAVNEDAVQVFLDIAAAAEASDDNARKFLALMEIGSMRGGRALAALASNVAMVQANIEAANIEWDEATSLIVEYERALQSTKMQLGMLKNNISDVGITLGDAILPVVNQIIQILVPGLQMLSKWFSTLPKQTQLLAIGLVMVVIVAGPLLMFLGQIFHAVTLIVMGFGQLIRIVPLLAGGIARLIPIITGAAGALLSWPGMAVMAVVLVLKALSKMGVDVAGFFKRLGTAAKTWGENLAKNLANGLLAGAIRFVVAAVRAIANIIASFFESHSPPKEGPLSTINKWGSQLLQTFLEGFKNADFSVLKEVGQIIETILTRGADEKELPNALKRYAKARVILAKLIAKYNKTGLVDEGLLKQVTKGLGKMADEVRQLIRLSLEYNRLQEKLADIERRRKEVSKAYDEEIAAIARSNMSIEEKVAAIRAAQRARDDSLRGLDKEEEATQAQADAVKQQLEYQQQMIDAMNEQDDILQRIADAIEALKKALKGAGGGGGLLDDFQFDMPSGDDLKKTFETAMEPLMEFVDRFAKGRQELQGFIDGWNGLKPKTMEELGLPTNREMNDQEQKLYDMYMAMYNLGQRAGETRDTLVGFWETASGIFAGIAKFFQDMKGGGGGGISLDFSGITNFIGALIQGFRDSGVIDTLQDFQKALGDIWAWVPRLVGGILEFAGSLLKLVGVKDTTSAVQSFGYWLGVLVGVFLQLGAAVITGVQLLTSAFLFIVTAVTTFLVGLTATVYKIAIGIGQAIADGFQNGWQSTWEKVKTVFSQAWDDLVALIKKILGISSPSTIFQQIGENLIQGLINGIESLLGLLGQAIQKIGDTIIGGIKKLFGGGDDDSGVAVDSLFPTEADMQARSDALKRIVETFQTEIQRSWEALMRLLQTSWDTVWQAIYGALLDYTDQILVVLKTIMETIVAQSKAAKSGVDALRSSILSTKDSVSELYDELKKLDGLVVKVTVKIDRQGSTSAPGGGGGGGTGGNPRASGGITEAGHLYTIGERGPEGFIAPMRGMVIPTASLRRFFAASGNTPTMMQVIFNNPVVREEQDLRRIVDAVARALSGRAYGAIKFGGTPTY